ncbi:MAG: hypothetical protein KatS3mg060_2269 [Dehalococcoidia bacterium]|nr:MAG: hypothetical protein KatS3mg060_2269 [Dehalococcoidia bacterium]
MDAGVNGRERSKLTGYLGLIRRHRGEPAGSYDEVASVYDSFAKVWDRRIAAPALGHFDRIVEERVPPGALVLDAGAGTGERTLAILRHSEPGDVIALDASAAMLDIARSKIRDPRVRFMLGDLQRLPFDDDTFDVVSCSWAIEIMADPARGRPGAHSGHQARWLRGVRLLQPARGRHRQRPEARDRASGFEGASPVAPAGRGRATLPSLCQREPEAVLGRADDCRDRRQVLPGDR